MFLTTMIKITLVQVRVSSTCRSVVSGASRSGYLSALSNATRDFAYVHLGSHMHSYIFRRLLL